ncbi:hypothetical protein PanWU01x14_367610 [Parasponia andersonii]|uniref:Uncharacterized protein n=1 Tax=Parasponia andersonii TaxID=3476 RepID=A0A2P5A595_PARAD|nr:hypothetical protein PanWU01x14_367610 [Parasponia andersonii]
MELLEFLALFQIVSRGVLGLIRFVAEGRLTTVKAFLATSSSPNPKQSSPCCQEGCTIGFALQKAAVHRKIPFLTMELLEFERYFIFFKECFWAY